jgi:HPt (histidine-containing phosphotransfer) domain-containing protein
VEIRRCIAAGSADGLFKIAHLVRGSAGHFGARHVTPLAASLENLSRAGALVDAEQYFLPLQQALEQLRVTLEHYADDRTG